MKTHEKPSRQQSWRRRNTDPVHQATHIGTTLLRRQQEREPGALRPHGYTTAFFSRHSRKLKAHRSRTSTHTAATDCHARGREPRNEAQNACGVG